MAFKAKRKKPPVLSKEDRAYVQEKLNVYKKFFKPLKGEFIYKVEGSKQEVVATARYYTEADIKKDAEETVARMNGLSRKKDDGRHWILVSWRVIGKSESPDDDTQAKENTNEAD